MLQTGLRAACRAGLVWPRCVAPCRHRVAAVPCYRAPRWSRVYALDAVTARRSCALCELLPAPRA
eukprot:4169491-Lingulodinium_polyedra.AAC.1